MATLTEIIAALSGASFASLDYVDSRGERAVHNVTLCPSYSNALSRSVEKLEEALPTLSPDKAAAAAALLESLRAKLAAPAPAEDPTYKAHGNGVHEHRTNGTLYFYALTNGKRIVAPAPAAEKPSRKRERDPAVVAREALAAELALPVARWRRFTVDPAKVRTARLAGQTWEAEMA